MIGLSFGPDSALEQFAVASSGKLGITLSSMSRTDSTTGQYVAGLLPQAHLAQQRQHLIMEHV